MDENLNFVTNYFGRVLNHRESALLFDIVEAMSMTGVKYSKQDYLDSFKFNLNFLKTNSLNNINLGYNEKFTIKRAIPSQNIHQESVIEYHFLKEGPQPKSKEIISTFGFYFTLKDNKITLNISNIQGYVNKTQMISKKNVLEYNKKKLDALNEELAMNWRVKVVSLLKKYAENRGYNICLQLPFKTGYGNKSDYLRQIRQYIQSGLKAGLNLEQISTNRINDKEIKEKIISNLDFKKKSASETIKKKSAENTSLRRKIFSKKRLK